MTEQNHVICTYHTDSEELKDIADNITLLQLDTTDETQIERTFEQLAADGTELDGLVYLAGYEPMQPFDQITAEAMRRSFDINTVGAALALRYAAPILKNPSSVVLTSLVISDRPNAMDPSFGAAKLAVENLAKSAAAKFREQGIRVNAIRPGAIGGPNSRLSRAPAPVREQLQPAMGDGVDLAPVFQFLLSAASHRINGTAILADGGASILQG
ncbi:MAG: SDR family oxidoreductase [Bacteroidota bacterium]